MSHLSDSAKRKNPNEFENKATRGRLDKSQDSDILFAPICIRGSNLPSCSIAHPLKLDKFLKENQIDKLINDFKRDRKNNVLLYPANQECAEEIMKLQDLFVSINCSLIDFNDPKNKPAIIIRGVSIETLREVEAELIEHGIIETIELKNPLSNTKGVIKAICESTSAQQKLLRNELKINRQVIKTEPFVRVPRQCKKCKLFDGHIEKNCPNGIICANCSGAHAEEDCIADKSKCINCRGEHNAFNRKCSVFQKHLKEAKNKASIQPVSPKNKPGSRSPQYNTITKSNMIGREELMETVNSAVEKTMEACSANLINQINTLIDTKIHASLQANFNRYDTVVNSKLSNVESKLNSNFSEAIAQNNIKMCQFVYEVVKATAPNNKDVLKSVNNSFSKHIGGGKFECIQNEIKFTPSIVKLNTTQSSFFNQSHNE